MEDGIWVWRDFEFLTKYPREEDAAVGLKALGWFDQEDMNETAGKARVVSDTDSLLGKFPG